MTKDQLQKAIFFAIPSLIACALIAIAMTPALRLEIQRHFSNPGYEVLATAEGDLLGDGSLAKVVKYRSQEEIFVEVLKVLPDGGTKLVDRILLPDKHDGLFNYHGHVTRLAIADIENDGKMELLAPSFDNHLVPHLNAFVFNAETGKFELYKSSNK